MAADLTIVESVGQALTEWTPSGSLVPVALTIKTISDLVFNDSPEIDSLSEYQKTNNEKLQQLNDTMVSSTSGMETLTESVENLTTSIDAFMGFQYFVFGTIFSICIVGYLGQRVKRLFTWGKLKRKEGLM